ncbi:MAG: hypothetical protein MUE30_06335 [Spirosomaceae bacterium]|jgi:putative salt-induced outer membrane protein|nr:hypothetical protein [Spirosomataceae bacterium]
MKRTIRIILVAVVATLSVTAQTTPPADSIFAKYYEATGGKALWDSVKTCLVKQTYRSNSANDYDLEIRASVPLQALSKIRTIMKRDFISGIRGNDGWVKVPLGSKDKVTQFQTSDLSEKERDNMRRELRDMWGAFDDYAAKAYIVTVTGTESINNTPVYQVEINGKGIKYNLFFEVASGLLVRERLTLPTNETQTRDHGPYIASKFGLLYPSESTLVSSIDRRPVKVTTQMEFNVKLPDDSFVK